MPEHRERTASLGDVIRRRRSELGLTQEELAERVGGGMRQSDVSRVERGEVTLPRRQRLEQIAAALEMSLGALLTEAGWLAGAGTPAPPRRPEVNRHGPHAPPGLVGSTDGAMGREQLHDAMERSACIQRRSASIVKQAREAVEKARRAREENE